MNPSTGTFISMDSYAGTIYDPVSLHKYLYANANPVMNTDPSGYTSLSELATSISTHVSKIASAVYNNRILRTLSGAVTGAIIGGIDSGLGGNDIKQVLHDALWGAGIGAVGACFLPELLCLVISCVPKLIALKGMSYLLLLSGGLGVAESLNEGNGKQALFRGILTLVSFIGFRATLKNLKVIALTENSGGQASFATDELLEQHYQKHGSEFKGAFNSAEEYLKGAQDVMKNGYRVVYNYKGEQRYGYIKFFGNNSKGQAKFAFVGTNNDGFITTFHTESGNSFWKMLNGFVIHEINPE